MDDIDYDMHDEADWLARDGWDDFDLPDEWEPDPDIEREEAATRRTDSQSQYLFEQEWLRHEGRPHPNEGIEGWFAGSASYDYADAKRAEWSRYRHPTNRGAR